MEVLEAIYNRRTVRAFRPDSISEEVLTKILEAATWAPSHGNNQPWEFVIAGAETRQKLLSLYQEMMESGPLKNPALPEERKEKMRQFMQNFGGAPTLLAVTLPAPTMEVDKYDFPLAGAAAIQNLLLAAWEQEVGAVWLSFGANPQAKAILGVEEAGSISGILAMGYPLAVPPAQPRIPVADKIRRLP